MVSINGLQDIVKRGSTNNVLTSGDIQNIVQALPETLGTNVDLTSLTSIVKEARGLPVDQAVAYLYQMLSLVDSDPRSQELELEDDTISLSSALATKLGISDGSAPLLDEEESRNLSARLGTIADVFARSDVKLEGNDTEDNLTDDRFILTGQYTNYSAPLQDELQSVFEILGFDQVLNPDDTQLTYGYFTNGTTDVVDDGVGVIPDDYPEISDQTIFETPIPQQESTSEEITYTRQQFQDLISNDTGEVDYELLRQALILLGVSEADAKTLSDNLESSAIDIKGILEALDDKDENITSASVKEVVDKAVNSLASKSPLLETNVTSETSATNSAETSKVSEDKALQELKSALALIGVNGNILDEADPEFVLEFYKKFGSRPAGAIQLMLDGNGDDILDENDASYIKGLTSKDLNLDSQLEELSSLNLNLHTDKKEALKIIHFSGALKSDGSLHTINDLPDNIDDIKDLVAQGQDIDAKEEEKNAKEEVEYTRKQFQDLTVNDAGKVDYDILKKTLILLGASREDAQELTDNLKNAALEIGGILDALDDDKQNITTQSVKKAIDDIGKSATVEESSTSEKEDALQELKSSLALIGVGGNVLNEADPDFVLEFYKKFGNRPAGVIQLMLDGNGDNILDENDLNYIKSLDASSLNLSSQLEKLSSLNLSVNDDREAILRILHLSGALKPDGSLYELNDLPETIDEVKNLVKQGGHKLSPTNLL